MIATPFCPTETIEMPTSYGIKTIPAERYGELLVIQMPRRRGGYFTDRCAVIFARATAGVVCFTHLHVAQNFARELDYAFDLRRLWFKLQSGESGVFTELLEYTRQRAEHPALVPYNVWSGDVEDYGHVG